MPESVKRRGSSGPTTGAMLGLWSGVVATAREGYGRAVQLLLAMVLLMWALEVVDTALDNRLDRGGIIPREAEGLDGVIAAPFLHVGFGHLIANTLPFVAMGLVIGLEGPLRLLDLPDRPRAVQPPSGGDRDRRGGDGPVGRRPTGRARAAAGDLVAGPPVRGDRRSGGGARGERAARRSAPRSTPG